MAQDSVANLPDVQTAENILLQGIAQRVFFNKLAAAGYTPRTAEQAQYLWHIGGQLTAAAEHQHVKQAEAEADPFYKAAQALDNYLAANGIDTGMGYDRVRAQEADLSILKAAQDLAAQPEIYNSVLMLKAQEAAEYAQL